MNNFTANITSAVISIPQPIGLLTGLKHGVHSANFLFGLPTHLYVIWLIVTRRQVESGFFNLNFSVCEIVNCLNSFLTVLSNIPWLSSLTTFTFILIGFAITGRPLFQSLMCFERYLAVVHPVTFLKYKPLRYRVICCSVVWITTVGSCFYCVFSLVFLPFYFYTSINMIQFLLFIFIQLFCLVAVLRALKQSGPGERNEENHMKRRAFYLILITTVSMVFTYMPFMLLGFFYVMIQSSDEPLSVGVVCFILGGFVQPVLYLHWAGKLSCLCSS